MKDFDEPREIEIQWTREFAETQSEEDEDSLDEEAISDVDWQIGESRETIEITSWSEIPEGYEPVNENDLEEYQEYLNNKQAGLRLGETTDQAALQFEAPLSHI